VSDAVEELLSKLRESLAERQLVSLILSKPPQGRGTIRIRPVEIRGELMLQWADDQQRQSHANLSPAETEQRLRTCLDASDGESQSFRHLHLLTTTADYALRINRRGKPHLSRNKASRIASYEHDRAKPYVIPEGEPCPFLEAIGVMRPGGSVRHKSFDKFRQINRFLEFVQDVVPELPKEGTLRVIDFGSGKSYLTFALHHLLAQRLDRQVAITAIDRDASVIKTCRQIASSLELQGLDFQVGDIASYPYSGTVDLAVSLHACDTATDDALARAVAWNARVIMAAPCCQHELAGRIHSEPLAALERHGILKERFAAEATDALRAAALEQCGYKTRVMEFIDLEHTPKNVLIRAIRRPNGDSGNPTAREEYRALKELLGLDAIYLEQVLDLAKC